MGADPDDAALVQVHQRLVGDVGDFPGDLFLAPLGVPHVQLELLDVDRRVDVVLDQPLGEHDRVFEVVSVPGHERHRHVAAQGQLAGLGGGAVGHDLAVGHPLALVHQGPLVDGGVLVGAPVLLDPVPVHLRQPGERLVSDRRLALTAVDDDLVRGNPGDHAAPPRRDDGARVPGHLLLQPGADQRRLREEQRHRLPLHVASPSARGSRRRAPGTESAPRRWTPAAPGSRR